MIHNNNNLARPCKANDVLASGSGRQCINCLAYDEYLPAANLTLAYPRIGRFAISAQMSFDMPPQPIYVVNEVVTQDGLYITHNELFSTVAAALAHIKGLL